ncbi:MAG: type IV pilin accessory protein, partial [Acinetobacter sp.]|nr:type IV pilin accessory protein [Acinetobacter sp.]
AQGRPVWIVFTNQRFELVRNNEIVWEHIENTRLEFQKTLFSKPQYAAVKYENDNIQKNNDIFTEVMGGVSLSQFPERYQSLDQVKNKITHQANHLTKLNDFNEKKQVEKIITKYPQATAWLPLKANTMDMVVLINREKGEVVKIVDLRPWK